MKKILIPTDFSKHAEYALEVAAQLAREHEGELYLLHMIELPADMVNPVGETRSSDLPEALYFMKLAKKRFSELLSRPYLQGLKIHEIVEFEKAFDGIMDTSREHGCDFIVMGSRGASGFHEIFVGSNTEKVVRTADVPVLVIKQHHDHFQVKNFVFATDLDVENRDTFSRVLNLAKLLGAKLHLLYINTANEFISSSVTDHYLEEYLQGREVPTCDFHVYNDATVEKGILNFSNKINADLVGIATHGRKGLAHFFNGSISEDLVNHMTSPVVTFKLRAPKKKKGIS